MAGRKRGRQKADRQVMLIYILGGIVLLSLLTFGGKLSSVQESTQGYSVISVQSVEVKSNMFGNGTGILLTLAVDGGGDRAVGEITEKTLKEWGLTGINVSKFKVKVYLEDFKYNYPLTQSKYFSGEDVILWKAVGSTAKQDCLAKQLPWGAVSKDTSIDYYYGRPVSGLVTTVPPIMPRGIENHIPKPAYDWAKKHAVEIGEWGYWMPEGKVKITYVKDQWGGTRRVEYDFGAGECKLQEGGGARGDWFVTNLAGIPYARVYDIGTSANKYYKIRVVLEFPNGNEVSAVLTPDQKTAMIGDLGRAKMLGDLGGERTPEIPAVDYKVIKFTEGVPDTKTKYAVVKPNAMKFVGKDVIENYKDSLMYLADLDNNYYTYEVQEGIKRIRVDPAVGANDIIGHWNTLNAMLAAAIEDGRKPSSCVIAGSVVSCDGSGGVSYPLIQLVLKADKIGLELLTGLPQIVGVDVPPKIYEGEPGIVKAKIKNGGEVDDSFDVSLSCPSEVSTTTDRIWLNAGEEGTATITVVSAVAGQYNCTLKMRSTSGAVTDEEPVLITVVQKPLPQEITMLRDIPQRVGELSQSVEELTKTVSLLVTLMFLVIGGGIIGLLGYLIYRRFS